MYILARSLQTIGEYTLWVPLLLLEREVDAGVDGGEEVVGETRLAPRVATVEADRRGHLVEAYGASALNGFLFLRVPPLCG